MSMAESISMTEALGGYKAAVEAPQWAQESKDQASLLSMQAEAAKEKMAAYKEEQTLQMQKRATLGTLARERSDIDMSNIEGQLKLSDIAIQQTKNRVVLMEKFQAEKQDLLKRKAEEFKVNAQMREEERGKKYDALSEALAAPELAANLTKSGDPALQHFGEMLMDRKPIAQFRDENGKPKFYSQLSGEELSRFREQVLSGVAPKGDAAALGRYSQHEIDWAREQERIRNDDLRAAANAAKTAAARDKIASDRAAKAAKDADKTKQMKEATDKYVKDKAETEAALLTAKQTGFYETEQEKETIRILSDKLKGIEDSYKEAQRMYGAKDIVTKQPKGTGTKENPIKLG